MHVIGPKRSSGELREYACWNNARGCSWGDSPSEPVIFWRLYVHISITYSEMGEPNMNSSKDKVAVVRNGMYVVLGASGNTGSIIANFLLLKGEKLRVVGREGGRLQRFARKGAEACTADLSDAAALTKAFSGARAAYLMLPPLHSREEQERQSDAISKAVKESGLGYAVHLSSYGAHVSESTGPITALRSSEQKLNAIGGFEVFRPPCAVF